MRRMAATSIVPIVVTVTVPAVAPAVVVVPPVVPVVAAIALAPVIAAIPIAVVVALVPVIPVVMTVAVVPVVLAVAAEAPGSDVAVVPPVPERCRRVALEEEERLEAEVAKVRPDDRAARGVVDGAAVAEAAVGAVVAAGVDRAGGPVVVARRVAALATEREREVGVADLEAGAERPADVVGVGRGSCQGEEQEGSGEDEDVVSGHGRGASLPRGLTTIRARVAPFPVSDHVHGLSPRLEGGVGSEGDASLSSREDRGVCRCGIRGRKRGSFA